MSKLLRTRRAVLCGAVLLSSVNCTDALPVPPPHPPPFATDLEFFLNTASSGPRTWRCTNVTGGNDECSLISPERGLQAGFNIDRGDR